MADATDIEQAPDPAAQQAAPQAAPSAAPAQAAPASAPNEAGGQKELAKVWVQTAMQLLNRAVPAFDLSSDERRTLTRNLESLIKTFGGDSSSKSLVPSQVLELVRSVQQQGHAPIQTVQ